MADERRTRSQMRDVLVTTTEPVVKGRAQLVERRFYFKSASEWGKAELNRLGVDFDMTADSRIQDLSEEMGWSETNWSPNLTESLPFLYKL
jgi:hypothetical protein